MELKTAPLSISGHLILQLVTHYLSMHKDADQHFVEGAIAEAKQLEKQLFPPKVPTCDICGKIITDLRWTSLKTIHLYPCVPIDVGVKNFPIFPFSGKLFKVRKLLTLHIAKFHSKVLCCELCDKKFYTKPLLYKHMQGEDENGC